MSEIFDGLGGQASYASGSAIVEFEERIEPLESLQKPQHGRFLSFADDELAQGYGVGAGIQWYAQIVKHMGIIIKEMTVTKTFSGTMNNSVFPLWNRTVGIKKETYPEWFLGFDGNRQWNGIGGIIYLPSFPQLSRQETSWPHAT